MYTRLSLGSVPFNIAKTFFIFTGLSTRSLLGWVNVSNCTVILPCDSAAYFSYSDFIQLRAAPMPVVLLVVSLSVCRVLKLTNFRMVASMFFDETSSVICLMAASCLMVVWAVEERLKSNSRINKYFISNNLWSLIKCLFRFHISG